MYESAPEKPNGLILCLPPGALGGRLSGAGGKILELGHFLLRDGVGRGICPPSSMGLAFRYEGACKWKVVPAVSLEDLAAPEPPRDAADYLGVHNGSCSLSLHESLQGSSYIHNIFIPFALFLGKAGTLRGGQHAVCCTDLSCPPLHVNSQIRLPALYL